MKDEWDDNEREPRRMVQMYDPQAQAAYKDWSAQTKLEWLASILKLYWAGRRQARALPNAAEPKKNYPAE